jgi:pantoate--beta-alanine ligase
MALIVADTLETLRLHRPTVGSIGFVPTMGNLHQGHLHLVKLALERADHVIVSLFVNRLQFAPHEDFDLYPRTQTQDIDALLSLNDPRITVFSPQEKILYPQPQTFRVQPDPMAQLLEGTFRPGFFDGVCTVVMKLFHIVAPHIAVFGKKDRQQLTLIQAMIQQFALPIQLIAGETIRETDGLALSSRNRYLSPEERQQAPLLYQALSAVKQQVKEGNDQYSTLEQKASEQLKQLGWNVDYIAIRDTATLSHYPQDNTSGSVVLGAARLGKTRLIDNLDIR